MVKGLVSIRSIKRRYATLILVVSLSISGCASLGTLVALQYIPLMVGGFAFYDSLSTDEGEFNFKVAKSTLNSTAQTEIANARRLVVLPIQGENMGALVDTARASTNVTIVSPNKVTRWLMSRGLHLHQMADEEKFNTITRVTKAHNAQLALLVDPGERPSGGIMTKRTRTITANLVSARSGEIIWTEKQKIIPKGLGKLLPMSSDVAYLYSSEILKHAIAGTMKRLSEYRGSTTSGTTISGNDIVRSAQVALNNKGYSAGSADGIMGPKTEAALGQFQRDNGLNETGQLDRKTKEALGI